MICYLTPYAYIFLVFFCLFQKGFEQVCDNLFFTRMLFMTFWSSPGKFFPKNTGISYGILGNLHHTSRKKSNSFPESTKKKYWKSVTQFFPSKFLRYPKSKKKTCKTKFLLKIKLNC